MTKTERYRGSALREQGCRTPKLGEVRVAGGERGDAVEAGREADAGGGRDVDGAVRRHSDFGIDDVFLPVALARGDIAGEREVRKRRQGDVLSAADAGFEHPSAPDGNFVAPAQVVDALGLKMAADASEFDVDDFARPERDGGFRVFVGVDAFVETNRSLEILLNFDVAEEVVPA